jgi:hypothetical protein
MKKLLLSFLACSLLTIVCSAQVETTLPAGVPDGFVVTPFGYFHPSCIKQLATGDVMHGDDMLIQNADGTSESMLTCGYDHYSSSGEAIPVEFKDDPSTKPYITHEWMVDVYGSTSSSSYGAITAKWKVPSAPPTKSSQVLYYFTGLEDYKDTVTILQPVLGWNAYYKNAWGIASWNCCVKGTVYVSPYEHSKTGDTIYGVIINNCKAGTLECKSWDVETVDETTKAWTLLSNESNFKQTFNWIFPAVMEVYSVSKCSDYPSKPLSFYDVAMYSDKFTKVDPSLSVSVDKKVSPQCGYGAYGSESDVTLTY